MYSFALKNVFFQVLLELRQRHTNSDAKWDFTARGRNKEGQLDRFPAGLETNLLDLIY